MKIEIRDLQTSITSLFRMDEIPFFNISSIHILTPLVEKFKFTLVPDNSSPASINLVGGVFNIDGKNIIADKIQITNRKIAIASHASSELTIQILHQLLSELKNCDNREMADYTSILDVYETVAIVKLPIGFPSIFADTKFASLLSLVEGTFSNSKTVVFPYTIRFKIKNLKQDPELVSNNLAISDKYFTIEQRDQTNPKENIFFTASPLSSTEHFKLLEEVVKLYRN